MTIEKFILIMIAMMVLHGLIVALCFLHFKKRSLQIRFLGVNFLCLFLSYYSVDIFSLRGMEVNIPANLEIFTTFFAITAMYYIQFQKRYTRFFLILSVLFAIFWLANIFFFQKTYFNSYSASVSNFGLLRHVFL
jgi:hypothetical protein